jgi:hypothetical protein
MPEGLGTLKPKKDPTLKDTLTLPNLLSGVKEQESADIAQYNPQEYHRVAQVVDQRYRGQIDLLKGIMEDPAKSAATSSFINDRLREFDPAALRAMPETALGIAFNPSAPQHWINAQARAYNAAVSWVLDKNSFAYEGGALAGARQYAIATHNKAANAFLDKMQGLDPMVQDAFLRTLRDPQWAANLIQGVGEKVSPEAQAVAQAGQYAEEQLGLHATVDPQGRVVYTIANHDKAEETLAGLRSLFPNNPAFWTGDPETQLKIADDSAVTHMAEIGQKLAHLGAHPVHDITSGTVATGEAALRIGGLAFEVPVGILKAVEANHPILRSLDHGANRLLWNAVAHQNLTDDQIRTMGIPSDLVGTFNKAYEQVYNVGGAIYDFQPFFKDADQEDHARDLFANVFAFWVINKTSEFTRAVKTSRINFPETAQAELGISDPLLETKFGRAQTSGPIGIATHPLQFMSQLTKRMAFEVAGFKSIDDAVNGSRIWQGTFDMVADINGRYDTIAARRGAIRDLFGEKMPVSLADRLARAERAGMEQVTIDYMHGLHDATPLEAKISRDIELRDRQVRTINERTAARSTTTINLPADKLVDYLVSPERARSLVGRTEEGMANLRESLRGGYDATRPYTEGGGPVGPIEMEFDPNTGRAVIREGHHRIGISAELGQDVPVAIKIVDHIDETVGKDIAEIQGTVDPALAELSALSEGRPMEGAKSLRDLINERTPAAEDLRRFIDEWVGDNARAAELRLENVADTAKLDKLMHTRDGAPLFQFPKTNPFKRFAIGESSGWLGRFGKSEIGVPLRKALIKTVDELPTSPHLYSPSSGDKPLDWREHNADTMNNWLRRAGLPDTLVHELVGQLTDVKSGAQFYEWEMRVSEQLDLHLPENIPAELRNGIVNWHQTPIDERGGGYLSATDPIVGREVGDGTFSPLPSSPTDFLGNVVLPSVDKLIEATSNIRSFQRWLKKNRWRGGIVPEAVIAATKFVLATTTGVLKAPILVLRLPAMASRIQLEQAMRAHLFGGYKGLVYMPGGLVVPAAFVDSLSTVLGGPTWGGSFEILKPDPRFGDFARPEDMDLGSMHSQLIGESTGGGLYSEPMGLYNNGALTPKPGHYTGLARMIQKIHTDWFDRKFVQLDLDPVAMKEWVNEGGHEAARRYVYDEQLNVLRGSHLDVGLSDEGLIDSWLERKRQQFLNLEARVPGTIEAVKTGTYERGGPSTFDADPLSGRPMGEVLTERRAELDSVNSAVRRATPGSTESIAMRRKAKELRGEIRLMEDQGAVDKTKINVEDTRKVANDLERRFQGGEIQFPDRVTIKRRYSWADREGLIEGLKKIRDGYNQAFYAPFKALSWADVRGTRGSMYYQAAERYREGLMARGMSKADATAWAQVKAATLTRDLMYDLSARTSLQRSLKDVFWFGPAVQEILYTWGVRIPSQYAGGTGYFLVPAKLKALTEMLKSTGFIQKDQNGDDVVMVPGMAALLDHILPGEQNFGQVASFKLSGLNFVASSPVPSLNTIAAFGLAQASRKYGGVLHDLNSIFNQYGSDISGTPRQIALAWEAMTGKPWPAEFLSPDYSKAQYDRAMDQALQFSYQHLLDSGVKVPRAEDFATRDQYDTARDTFMEQVMNGATDYFKAVAWQRLAGATVTPASVYVSQPEYQAWQTFRNQVVGDPGPNGYSDKQRSLIEDYVSKHPNSLAYTIGYTVYGQANKELPYQSTGDEQFFDKFYTGEAKVMEPGDYAKKLMTIESYRFYLAQKNATLQTVGDTAPELLAHGFERGAALAQFSENWDRYLSWNPEAEGLYNASRHQWAKYYGTPENSFEVERISKTLELLNQLSPVFTGESGMRSSEFRDVVGKLKALYSDNAEFGRPTTQIGKDMAWYYDNVLQPYFDRTEGLYQQAHDLTVSGEDAGEVFDQIRVIQQSFTTRTLTHNGQVFPSPEAVFYGNKNPVEQDAARYNWATKPPTWLTDFQLDTSGLLPQSPNRTVILGKLADFDNQFNQFLIDKNVSTSSAYYHKLQRWADTQRAGITGQYGAEGQQILDVYNETPFQRLTGTGYGQGNATWAQTAQAASYVVDQLTKEGVSIKGFSANATYYKEWLYKTIEAQRDSNKAYDQLWIDLSYALPMKGYDQREGVPLYEAVLFGNFRSDLIPPTLINSVTGGQ